MSHTDISNIRREYISETLDEKDIHENPFKQFEKWMEQALNAELLEATAMTLATASVDGLPTARIVLLKEYDESGFVFYTNYDSRKGHQIAENPSVCLLFYWVALERQVTIEGKIEKIDRKESEEYFHSRPFESQIGAMASEQSTPVSSRKELEDKFEQLLQKYGDKEVPMPDSWGGYKVIPERIEFWQGRRSRMHDRIEYQKQTDGDWRIQRLAP